jgi:hypothetical protein
MHAAKANKRLYRVAATIDRLPFPDSATARSGFRVFADHHTFTQR